MSLQLVAHWCTLMVLGRIMVKALGACVLHSELILFRQCATVVMREAWDCICILTLERWNWIQSESLGECANWTQLIYWTWCYLYSLHILAKWYVAKQQLLKLMHDNKCEVANCSIEWPLGVEHGQGDRMTIMNSQVDTASSLWCDDCSLPQRCDVMYASKGLVISPPKIATALPCHMLSVRLYLAAASVFVFPCNQRRSKAYPLAVPK